jgi:hypothetical protein
MFMVLLGMTLLSAGVNALISNNTWIPTNTYSDSGCKGAIIIPSVNITIKNMTKWSGDGSVSCAIYPIVNRTNYNSTAIGTGTFSGDVCNINANLTKGVNYIACANSSSSVTRYYRNEINHQGTYGEIYWQFRIALPPPPSTGYSNDTIHGIIDLSTIGYELNNGTPTIPANITAPVFIQNITLKILQNTTILVNWSAVTSNNSPSVFYNLSVGARLLNGTLTAINYTYNATDPLGTYRFNLSAYDGTGVYSNKTLSNAFDICALNYSCVSYGSCLVSNISPCLAVFDNGCLFNYTGNLSEYDINCTYVPMTSVNWLNFDLANSNNVFLFGIFIILWLGLAVMSFVFRNIFIAGMMFIVGVGLGFMVISVSIILTLMFLFMSTMLFMYFNKGG